MEKEKLEHLRHSAAHLLAAAVMELWPDTKRTIGPAIDDGFYFDFEFSKPVTEEDLPVIEAKMQELIKSWPSFERQEISKDEALQLYPGNEYKAELIEEFAGKGETLTVYKSGDYQDLCRGGHVENPSEELKYFKLLSIAGAYWRGNEKNKMLTRIYGTAFFSQQELDDFLVMKDEAKKRDHKKLARELDLVVFSPLVGAGLPMYTPRGTVIRSAVYNYSRELNKEIGYDEVATPNFNRAELFKISGHYDKYKDDMLQVVSHYSDEEMYFKPMNCPQHTQIYASRQRSYKDLPIRYADFANLARDERPGELNGLLRSRVFTQDDAHCFCREDQIKAEAKAIAGVIINGALKTYGMKYKIRLSLWDPEHKEKYLGKPESWENAQQLFRELMQEEGYEYFEAPGEAAFYGPKMDFMAIDSIGREWQISTIQIDFNQPERFKLEYTDVDGAAKRPVMIHRALIGSERFIGILIEHYAGAFPAWLSPEHVRVIPIGENNIAYAEKIKSALDKVNVRTIIDADSERMQNKIRKAQEMKVPYMLIVGKNEEAAETVSLRYRSGEEVKDMKLTDFVEKISANIAERKTEIIF